MIQLTISAKTYPASPKADYVIQVGSAQTYVGVAEHWRLGRGLFVYRDHASLTDLYFSAKPHSSLFSSSFSIDGVLGAQIALVSRRKAPFLSAVIVISTESSDLMIRTVNTLPNLAQNVLSGGRTYSITNKREGIGEAQLHETAEGWTLQLSCNIPNEASIEVGLITAGVLLITERLREISAITSS